jgi:hypothetical protein
MDPALASAAVPAPNNFHDGLGERRRVADTKGDTVELLCLRRQLTSIPSFEFALRERAGRLANFRHTYFGRVRGIDRLNDPGATLAVVSDMTRGVRLSQLLTPADGRSVTIDINAALHLIRQFVSAIAMLHENAPDVAHGAISPERLVVTSNARVVIVEYVLGAALEQLRYSPERYWKELRVALPPGAGDPRFDQRTDVTQIGVVALSLVLGRLLTDDETPENLADVLASARGISGRSGIEPLPPGLRTWIGRALQIDSRHSFESALDARVELDRVLDGEDDGDDEPFTAPQVTTSPAPAAAPAPVRAPMLPRTIDAWEPYGTVAKSEETIVADIKPVVPMREPVHVELTPEPTLTAVALEPIAAALEPKLIAVALEPKPIAVALEPKPLVAERTPFVFPSEAAAPGVVDERKPADALVVPLAGSLGTHDAAMSTDGDDWTAMASEAPARSRMPIAIAAAALIAIAAGGAYVAKRSFAAPTVVVPTTGVLTVASNPPGATVFVDNVEHGATPLTLTLAAGSHFVELRGGGEARTLPITITGGMQTSQYIELPATAASTVGALQVRTEPAGAQVSVDGVARGKSPVLVENLAPGEHAVTIAGDFGTMKQAVTVQAATTASLVVPLSMASMTSMTAMTSTAATAGGEGSALSGWVSLAAPAEVQLFENKKLIGTSQSDRIMVAAGRHEIELVNEAIGYRASTVVQVSAGKVAPIKIEWPKGSVSLNALPWAEVWIDGEKSGETPIGNLSLPIGQHDVLFRHPDLGEQHNAITVSLTAPVRVSVDLRKDVRKP